METEKAQERAYAAVRDAALRAQQAKVEKERVERYVCVYVCDCVNVLGLASHLPHLYIPTHTHVHSVQKLKESLSAQKEKRRASAVVVTPPTMKGKSGSSTISSSSTAKKSVGVGRSTHKE